MREIIALEEQGHIHRLRKRIGGAVGEVETRFRVEALAEVRERYERLIRLQLVKRNDLEIVVLEQKAPKARLCGVTMTNEQHNAGLVHIDSRDQR